MLLAIHTAFGIVALVSGAWNLLARKGDRRHRAVGYVYAGSMTGLVLTSFGIFEVFSGFGPFHALSLVSGGTLALAMYFPLRRDRHDGWLEHHYMWITYSYVGLVMATGSHLFEVVPSLPGWAGALLFWVLPYVVGSALIFARKQALLDRMRTENSAQTGGQRNP
jgi:uncharacterized membrane protein